MPETLQTTDFKDLHLCARGKVRDIYEVGEQLLIVATDRISAFDHVLGTGIPDKGKVLTQLSLFWFDKLRDLVPNHLITANVAEYPAALRPYREQLYHRSMLVERAKMFPVECVVRCYLAGSAWKEYQATGHVGGTALLRGLHESDKLPEPLFTPATKSPDGEHDVNISFADMADRIGRTNAELLRDLSLLIFDRASKYADGCGLILADTKFEFGTTSHGVLLADEVLTPDSSRYWPKSSYKPGGPQISFDKQFVRDYLEEIRWNKQAPAPTLPEVVVSRTRDKYIEAFRRITGRPSPE